MCLVCKDEKILWQAGPAGSLTVGPCPYCNEKPKEKSCMKKVKIKEEVTE